MIMETSLWELSSKHHHSVQEYSLNKLDLKSKNKSDLIEQQGWD